MKYYQNALSVRGDCLYCPLSFSLDSYWNCLTDCWHCYFRNLNNIWGTDLRPTNPEDVRKKLETGLKNKNPKSSLAYCIKLKKTIRLGNKSDPLQDAEDEHHVTEKLIKILNELNWTYVIQTRFPIRLLQWQKVLIPYKDNITIMPIISPGLDYDWEIFERKRTNTPIQRLKVIRKFAKLGFDVGINGEPFIPGVHSEKDFESTIQLLKEYGVKSYNTYNFHFNAFVAKRLHSIGIDIEKIWYYNQDKQWKKILSNLMDICKKHNMVLGCPDFVNSGPNVKEVANTCCGVNVPNPIKFNTHYWKGLMQNGLNSKEILNSTWEGIGNFSEGEKIVKGTTSNFYTLGDIN